MFEDEYYCDDMTEDEYDFASDIIDRVNTFVESKNKILVRQNQTLNRAVNDQRKRIYELEQQLKDLPKLKEQAHEQAVDELFDGFKKGQKVWLVQSQRKRNDCSRCNGKRKLAALLR